MIFTKQQEAEWTKVTGSPDYVSVCGAYISVYKHSYKGFAAYWCFPVDSKPKDRTVRKALCVGGLGYLSSIRECHSKLAK